MFKELEKINHRPEPFQYYAAEELWTTEHTSKMMLEFHLNDSVDLSSRNIKFINRSVDWISSQFGVDETKNICDFGCGPGLYTTSLAARGAKVTGIDFSIRSINYAKKVAAEKGLAIDYVHKNYLNFETDKRFNLITMIMCDFCALSPEQRRELLKKFHKLLKPNGSVLLDVYSLEAFNKREGQTAYAINLLDGFWSPEKYYGFLNTFKYDDEKVVLDKYTIVEQDKIREVYNWLQYFSKESLIEELERNSLKVVNIYADIAGARYDLQGNEMAVIAEKTV